MLSRCLSVAVVAGLVVHATESAAADLNFCWAGANGYTMTGRMQVPDSLMSHAVLTENDITSFKISGYLNGQLLGNWNMKQAGEDSTFHLRFDPVGMTFLTGGSFPATHSQGWNADGNVANCGSPGFGFNSGNYAQDVCVNGRWMEESSIAPETPFLVTTQAVTTDCKVVSMTSKSRMNESFSLTANH